MEKRKVIYRDGVYFIYKPSSNGWTFSGKIGSNLSMEDIDELKREYSLFIPKETRRVIESKNLAKVI